MEQIYFPAYMDCNGSIRAVDQPSWRRPMAQEFAGISNECHPELGLFVASVGAEPVRA